MSDLFMFSFHFGEVREERNVIKSIFLNIFIYRSKYYE